MKERAKQLQAEMKSSRHCSYLLRLWRNNGQGGSGWRASLEIPETGERIGFASLEELFAYLMDLTLSNELYKGHEAP
jgi:hypothetical protein